MQTKHTIIVIVAYLSKWGITYVKCNLIIELSHTIVVPCWEQEIMWNPIIDFCHTIVAPLLRAGDHVVQYIGDDGITSSDCLETAITKRSQKRHDQRCPADGIEKRAPLWFHSTVNIQDSQPFSLEMFQVSLKLNFREDPTCSISELMTQHWIPGLCLWTLTVGSKMNRQLMTEVKGKAHASESKAGEPGPTSVSISTGLQCILTLW